MTSASLSASSSTSAAPVLADWARAALEAAPVGPSLSSRTEEDGSLTVLLDGSPVGSLSVESVRESPSGEFRTAHVEIVARGRTVETEDGMATLVFARIGSSLASTVRVDEDEVIAEIDAGISSGLDLARILAPR